MPFRYRAWPTGSARRAGVRIDGGRRVGRGDGGNWFPPVGLMLFWLGAGADGGADGAGAVVLAVVVVVVVLGVVEVEGVRQQRPQVATGRGAAPSRFKPICAVPERARNSRPRSVLTAGTYLKESHSHFRASGGLLASRG
jgi:hypothetical protein